MPKISVVYIGDKPQKKDTVAGSRLVFPRHKEVPVEEDVAYRLLEFPSVWVLAEEAEDIIKAQQKRAKALAEAEAERLAQQKQAELDASMLAIVNGETIDLAKYSSKQLDTVVVAEELTIEAKDKKPVGEYCKKVRDLLREKNGEPELEDQE